MPHLTVHRPPSLNILNHMYNHQQLQICYQHQLYLTFRRFPLPWTLSSASLTARQTCCHFRRGEKNSTKVDPLFLVCQ
ncbi:hypothetical protein I307_06401 [Cryptococcus deuterogattii 99/473]|uniref:Uncharacterized protein n=1 Tax=Cryptococcus deuterogattii Ram5 TaxID=1296110 RepID=A0A0D0T874_9TREE|nr:hypothetical protein I313_01375 [Cryptococcus deuterogattii Ram5]KIY54294.1 hypothetical protein I307_06401 [Cryptococcus deuterogattii 99/473]